MESSKERIRFAEIVSLEKQLLQHTTRQSRDKLDQLLAEDFQEFGRRGKVYSKKDILAYLPIEESRTFDIQQVQVKALACDVCLITYVSLEDGARSLRSSIWKKTPSGWKIVFHQGTGKT